MRPGRSRGDRRRTSGHFHLRSAERNRSATLPRSFWTRNDALHTAATLVEAFPPPNGTRRREVEATTLHRAGHRVEESDAQRDRCGRDRRCTGFRTAAVVLGAVPDAVAVIDRSTPSSWSVTLSSAADNEPTADVRAAVAATAARSTALVGCSAFGTARRLATSPPRRSVCRRKIPAGRAQMDHPLQMGAAYRVERRPAQLCQRGVRWPSSRSVVQARAPRTTMPLRVCSVNVPVRLTKAGVNVESVAYVFLSTVFCR